MMNDKVTRSPIQKDSNRIIKVEIKRIKLDGKFRQIFLINDISQFFKNQRSKLKHNFSQQLTASLCHEIMTPLNVIINISDMLLLQSKTEGQ